MFQINRDLQISIKKLLDGHRCIQLLLLESLGLKLEGFYSILGLSGLKLGWLKLNLTGLELVRLQFELTLALTKLGCRLRCKNVCLCRLHRWLENWFLSRSLDLELGWLEGRRRTLLLKWREGRLGLL
jgi:hypothetical protein